MRNRSSRFKPGSWLRQNMVAAGATVAAAFAILDDENDDGRGVNDAVVPLLLWLALLC